MSGPSTHGDKYWCIKSAISDDGDIYVMADRVEVGPQGELVCIGHSAKDANTQMPFLIIAPGKWIAVYAASCLDGSAVAVEHWEGEVVR